jgi:hypothetical protein
MHPDIACLASTVSGMAAAVSTVIAIGYPSMREELNCSEEQASLTLACFALGYVSASFNPLLKLLSERLVRL